MIRTKLLAAAGALLLTTPATAQSISQSDLEARYDRALAAGYKAMFLCSAIANAERNGTTRTPESVIEWELTGIQSPLNDIVGELPYEIVRAEDRRVSHVSVEWAENALPRFARHDPDNGCVVLPIGADEPGNNRWFAPNERIIVYSGDHSFEDAMYEIGDAAFDGSSYGADARTTSVIVISNGETELQLNASGFRSSPVPQRTWSVAKSIAVTLIGAAVYRGDADVGDSAGLGENRGDPRHEITIDQLLRMASGRYSDTPGNRTDALYFGGATVDEVALDWPLVNEPGTVFRYANNDTLAAIQAIENTFDDHPPSEIFEAIGMDYAVAETDWRGNFILSSQVWATDRDLAVLGELYLNDGVSYNGTRILPEGWVEYISTPSGPQPGGSRGWGYGAGWWLLNNSEGIPPDTFMAAGNRGQYVVVVPSRDVVIVRRGEDPAGGSGFDIVAFTRDVLAALEN